MNNETSTPAAASTPTQSQSQGSLRDGNNSLLTIVKAQIVFLLSTLTGEEACTCCNVWRLILLATNYRGQF